LLKTLTSSYPQGRKKLCILHVFFYCSMQIKLIRFVFTNFIPLLLLFCEEITYLKMSGVVGSFCYLNFVSHTCEISKPYFR